MSRLFRDVVDRTRPGFVRETVETAITPPPEAQRRRIAQRNTHHMLEHRAILVPADPRAGIVADQQRLLEPGCRQPGASRGDVTDRQEPVRQRRSSLEAAVIEIVAPPE